MEKKNTKSNLTRKTQQKVTKQSKKNYKRKMKMQKMSNTQKKNDKYIKHKVSEGNWR